MSAEPTFLDTLIPIVLIGFALWLFLFKMKMGEALVKAFEWCKENLKSKRHKAENPNIYNTIEYD